MARYVYCERCKKLRRLDDDGDAGNCQCAPEARQSVKQATPSDKITSTMFGFTPMQVARARREFPYAKIHDDGTCEVAGKDFKRFRKERGIDHMMEHMPITCPV
jgi:hypothetical protein